MSTVEYCTCETSQPDFSIIPNNEFITRTTFYINIVLEGSTEESASGWLQYEQLLDPERESSMLHSFVTYSYTKLQFCPDIVHFVVRRISSFAQRMVRDPQNERHLIIPMLVLISIGPNLIEEDDQEDSEEEPMMYLLKEVMIDEADLTEPTCAICLERLKDVVVRTPCMHVYHSACIYTWFDRSKTCPTCRFGPLFW